VSYSDNTAKTVAITAVMCSGFSSTSAGNKTITVEYEGKTATFKVNVNKKEEEPVPSEDDNTNTEDNTKTDDNTNTEDNTKTDEENTPSGDNTQNDDGRQNNNGDKGGDNTEIPTPVSEQQDSNGRIFSYDHTIVIENIAGDVRVCNMQGQLVFSGKDVKEIQINIPGIYIVKAGAMTQKVVIR
jgi:hypothetical protein